MRSKKLKPIKDQKGLVVGNFYIRALVNCHGEFWIEIYKVTKKPTLKNTWGVQKAWLFDYSVTNNNRSYLSKDAHVTDATGYYERGRNLIDYRYKDLCSKVLLPFSNKAYNYLKKQKTLKDFIQALNPGVAITEKMMDEIIFQFDMQKRDDAKMHEELMRHH